jgi:penicillin-binding protein 1A
LSNRRSRAKKNAQKSPNDVFLGFLRACFLLILIGLAIGGAYFGTTIYFKLRDLPDISLVERYEPIEAIQLFDRNDHLICTIEGDEDRRVVPLNQISTQMQQAILAAEDHHFFEHNGINLVSIFRAMLTNMLAGHVVEGGSTITQQLVKNLFFTDTGRTMDRKVKEAFVAWELERRYPKERILEMYLNQVYFGSNAYGIERAAARYFDKPAAALTLPEAAFLAGLVKEPSFLGAPSNRQAALNRQHEIIDKMVGYGYILPQQAEAARAKKLVFKHGDNPLSKYPYYISYVLQLLHERFTQAEMRQEGLRVYTNLDPKVQELAETTLNAGIEKAPKGVTQGALVSISVSNGAVLALVGGVGNFWKNQFNRAVNPHTVGSSFKPFVYLTAFLQGNLSPDSFVDDKPLVVHQLWGLPDYAPKNFDRKFMGKITIRKALALSRNVPSVRTGQLVGISKVIETARQAGITAKLDPNLSLALGSSAIAPLEMAGAYSTFARGGTAIAPQVIRRIENNKGQIKEIFETKSDKVFPDEPVAELVDVMQDVVKYGTGTQAKLADRPVAGKTGTADAGKDIWFIGFTPDLVTALWAGNDDNLPIPGTNVTGGVVMAKIWHTYNEAYYKEFPTAPGSFIAPSHVAKPNSEAGAEKLAKDGQAKPTQDTPLTNKNELSSPAPILSPPQSAVLDTSNKQISTDNSAANHLLPDNKTSVNPTTPTSNAASQPTSSVKDITVAPTPMPSGAYPQNNRPAPVQTLIPAPAPSRRLLPVATTPPEPAVKSSFQPYADAGLPTNVDQSPTKNTRRLYPAPPESYYRPSQESNNSAEQLSN